MLSGGPFMTKLNARAVVQINHQNALPRQNVVKRARSLLRSHSRSSWRPVPRGLNVAKSFHGVIFLSARHRSSNCAACGFSTRRCRPSPLPW
jgi:hypothetical protein